MRSGPPDEVLAGACTWKARVSSWLGGRLIAATIPIASGRVTGKVADDSDDDVIETLSMNVPRWAAPTVGADVIDWRPGASTTHPLARYGQTLDVTILVGSVITGTVWETHIGQYQIKEWSDDDGGMISVSGESRLARARDDVLLVPTSPLGTLMSEARRLAPAGMGVSFDPALIDRTCPPAMSWSGSRLAALREIARAWPAVLRVDSWGQIVFRAPLPAVPAPIVTLKDGRGGTLIAAPRADSRDGAYNQVVATSSKSDAADISGIASVTSGPMNINGDYGVVTKKWSSPLLETTAQANAAAQTILANSTRPAQAIPARIAPDPRLELDDAVEILRGPTGHMATVAASGSIPAHRVWVEDDSAAAPVDKSWGWVTAWDLPLTTDDGDMRVDVGLS
jgi:hypothetical protein